MSCILPPLNSLRAFASVGQYNSVAKAAKDLCVTPGAVSRHIKILEEHLSFELFERRGRNIILTTRGTAYWTEISSIFTQLEAETKRALEISKLEPLIVSIPRMFMHNWLLPRLPIFYQKYPSVDLQFVFSAARDESDPSAHFSIRLGDGHWPELETIFLFKSNPTPVCSPSYLKNSAKLKCINDLKNHTLLHSSHVPHYWEHWLGEQSKAIIQEAKNINFEGGGFEYHAALSGLGIGVAQVALLTDDLKAGHLVTPFPKSSGIFDAYYLVSFQKRCQNLNFLKFKHWIKSEIRNL